MMRRPTLLALTPELLAHILSYMRPFEVERVARTFSKVLTPLCILLLAPRSAVFRNARAMVARFPDEAAPLDTDGTLKSAYASAGLAGTHGPFSAPRLADAHLFTALDYLALDGDLRWLAPLDAHTAEEMSRYHEPRAAASAPQMVWLEMSVLDLGLALPRCFGRFMRDRALQNRIPSASASYFTFGSLIKLRDGGYALKFYSDQQGCYYWYLYMDAAGGECVVGSSYALEDEDEEDEEDDDEDEDEEEQEKHGAKKSEDDVLTDKDRELGIKAAGADELTLHATGFEEFLARTYLAEWAYFVHSSLRDSTQQQAHLPKPLEDYLVNVFSASGRAAV